MSNPIPLSLFSNQGGLRLGELGSGFNVPIKDLDSKTAQIENLAFQIECMLPKDKPFRARKIRIRY